MNAQFAGAGAKQIAFDADDVADVENLVQLVVALRNRVFADVDLKLFALLHQVQEAGLAHAANGLDAAGDDDARLERVQFLGRLGAFAARMPATVWVKSKRWP